MKPHRSARGGRRAVVLGSLLLVFVLLALAGWTALEGWRAKRDLEEVARLTQTLQRQITSGDSAGAEATVAAVRREAADARAHSRGPGWWLAGHLPVLGDDVRAVQTVAAVSGEVADALPRLLRVATTLRPEGLQPIGGRIDLAPIASAAPDVEALHRVVVEQRDRLRSVDTTRVLPAIGRPVDRVRGDLGGAARVSDRAVRAVRLLPPMLGRDGRRSYLLMFQNNAEARSTGGIAGSFAVLTAEDGRLRLREQGDASTIGFFQRPAVPLTADEEALFGANLARFPQNVTFTPDFPRSGEVLRAMWSRRTGQQVDGVLSIDPVALSFVLRGTGPVAVGGGQLLTADNVVRVLLSEVYSRFARPASQQEFFDDVARRIFAAVASGRGQPREVVRGLTDAIEQRRLMLWSARQDEQRLLTPTRLSGELDGDREAVPQIGVHLNDSGSSKLQYYLDYAVDVTADGCDRSRPVFDVSLRLRSLVPRGARTLPDYVVNNDVGGPRAAMNLTMLLYAPADGSIERATFDGRPTGFDKRVHDGRPVAVQRVQVDPRQQHRLTWRVAGAAGQTGPLDLRVTPGVRGTGVGDVDRNAC